MLLQLKELNYMNHVKTLCIHSTFQVKCPFMINRHDIALTALKCSGYQWLAQFRFILRLK